MMPMTLEGLQDAIDECNERRLRIAAAWLTELLVSASPTLKTTEPTKSQSRSQPLDDTHGDEQPSIRIAQIRFDNRKLHAVPHLLRDCKSPVARFLRFYAIYLQGERKAQEVWIQKDASRDRKPTPENKELKNILEELGEIDDSYLLFLRGIILSNLGQKPAARKDLFKSLNIQPWNWSAWMQLGCCFESPDELKECDTHLPKHPMTAIFFLRMGVEMNIPSDLDVKNLDFLLQSFPESFYIMTLRAQVCFQQKDWITAQQIWEHITSTDPYHMNDIDQYSNMLFVMKDGEKLFKIAHEYMKIEDDRPEVQVLIGNYFSMMDDHDKAIAYFTRAVHLDRSYRTAWKLIGHEYTYLKNYHAATEAYRRALDINQLDYRAWYGLGRAYDGLSMPTYALNYFHRALSLYSYDPAIWEATGMAYVALNKPQQAITCLRKGLAGGISKSPTDHERALHMKMATIFESLGSSADASECHRHVITISRRLGKPITDYGRSCTQLARYHLSEAMDSLRQSSVVPVTRGAGPHIASCRYYLELLIADNNARGAIANDEVATAKDMLRRLEDVRLP